MIDFAKWLKDTRESKGISQAELSRKVGLSRAAISRYESGERTRVTQSIYERIMNVIGLPAMTNREALMHDLDALTDAQLARVLNESTIDLALDKIICRDCKDEHGGKCPREKPDGPCVIDMAEWLGKPCKHDNLLEVPE